MPDHTLEIPVRGATLLAVPAVHFRIASAEKVYRLCHQSPSPPRAIAVELSPRALAAVVAWLRELGVGPGSRQSLPCMLGLAWWPEVDEEAGTGNVYSNAALRELLCLSATDSIIEAVRCALECDIPVYGVDLVAGPEMHPPIQIQDPAHALGGQFESYVEMNASFAAHSRDQHSAPQREKAMAGHLLTLLQQYPRVLFTGGLAHWHAIRALLAEPDFPARPLPKSSDGVYARVLVHPLLALRHLDTYPRLVQVYEEFRQTGFSHPEEETALQYFQCFQVLMQEVYESYFQEEEPLHAIDSKQADLYKLASVQRVLLSLCAIKLKLIPDLATVVDAARRNLSDRFCNTLANVLMDFNWASPDAYPDLPLIMPEKNQNSGEEIFLPWRWKDQPVPSFKMLLGQIITWPGGDFLLSALAFQAIQHAEETAHIVCSEPFSGRMYEGLDVQSTVRARLRGEQTIYVRRSKAQRRSRGVNLEAYEPTVYLFRPEGAPPTAHWHIYEGSLPHYFRKHLRDPDRLDAVIRRKGSYSVTGISYCHSASPPPSYQQAGISLKILQGITLFRPAHFTLDQEAYWLEATDYSRGPLYNGGDFSELKERYLKEHGIQLGEAAWSIDLVNIAIPFAQARVVVIAPDGFKLPASVKEEARRHQVEIALIPHAAFPQEQLREASIQYNVPLYDDRGVAFPHDIVSLLGAPDRYHDLLPPQAIDLFRTAIP